MAKIYIINMQAKGDGGGEREWEEGEREKGRSWEKGVQKNRRKNRKWFNVKCGKAAANEQRSSHGRSVKSKCEIA